MLQNLFLFLLLVSLFALIVGLIKPTVFSRLFKGGMNRKKAVMIFGILTIIFFISFGVTNDKAKTTNGNTQQPVTENTQVTNENENQNPTSANVTENQTPPKTEDKPAPTTTPAPVQAKQTDDQNIAPTSSETVSQKNAVAKAKSYLSYTAFSHDGLVDQLEYEQFSPADAVYGADNSGANWNEQAAKKAKSYMEYSAFSRGNLIDQLKYDKFTQEQAEYGANAVGL